MTEELRTKVAESRERMDGIARRLFTTIGMEATAATFLGIAIEIWRQTIGDQETITRLLDLANELERQHDVRTPKSKPS